MTLSFDEFLISRRYGRESIRIAKKYTKIIFEAGYTEDDIMRIEGYTFQNIMEHTKSPDSSNPWVRAVGTYRSYVRERDGRS